MGINLSANMTMLQIVAGKLGALREKVIFLGGCTTGLLLTDPGAADVRATKDVDLLVEAATTLDFHDIEAAMRKLGFQPDIESGIRCRWRGGGIIVDLMPDNESILGFSNCWYGSAIEHSVEGFLADGTRIRHVTAPYFIATKAEAFKGRGKGDFLGSHDFEDIITIIDGREELIDEITACESGLRKYIAATFQQWLEEPDLLMALAGHLPPDPESQKRFGILERRFRNIASIR